MHSEQIFYDRKKKVIFLFESLCGTFIANIDERGVTIYSLADVCLPITRNTEIIA